MTTLREKDITKLAVAIADDLFTDGAGERASRLVMTIDPIDGPPARMMGGWSERAVIDRVKKLLHERWSWRAAK